METSLHRDLKALYGGENDQFEVPLGDYRIDVVSNGRLVEIQVASLAAIRDKIRTLLKDHPVLVVKPIVVRKTLVKRASKDGPVAAGVSPKRGTLLDLFDELVHFSRVLPARAADAGSAADRHRGMALSGPRPAAALADERLSDGRSKVDGRSRDPPFPDGRRPGSADRCPLPQPFHTGHLAESLGVHAG